MTLVIEETTLGLDLQEVIKVTTLEIGLGGVQGPPGPPGEVDLGGSARFVPVVNGVALECLDENTDTWIEQVRWTAA